jgi:hypothetical protein
MSAPKLDDDAFTFYAMLGVERSFEAVAKHYHVNKRTVTRTATRERWAERLEEIEKKAREKNDAKLADTMHERAMRHRKMILAMASRAAKAIQEHQLDSCMDGIKAAEIAIKLERLIAGEPSENTTVSIEQATRDEMAKLLTTEEQDDWGDEPESDESDDGEASAATG